jgi:hypothetical protein
MQRVRYRAVSAAYELALGRLIVWRRSFRDVKKFSIAGEAALWTMTLVKKYNG